MDTASVNIDLARDLDARILCAHTQLRRAERDLALLLAEMEDTRRYLELGYANVHDYARIRLDMETRKTRGLIRIGRALPDFPGIDQAMASGVLCWTKARELLSVVTPETEGAWIEEARRLTSRALEFKVAAHAPGERPSDKTEKERGPVRLVFTMEPVEAEQVRTALAAIRVASGVSSDEVGDGALLAQMASRIIADLEDTEAPTGERFRFVIEHCPECRATSAPEAEVSDTHVGQALCDAEVLQMCPGEDRGHVSRIIPPATRRAVLHRDHHRCRVPGCSNRLWLDLHHLDYFSAGGDNSEANLITLCSVHHQLLHDGRLGIERQDEGLVFRFGDGRAVPDGGPDGEAVTHVGHGDGRTGRPAGTPATALKPRPTEGATV